MIFAIFDIYYLSRKVLKNVKCKNCLLVFFACGLFELCNNGENVYITKFGNGVGVIVSSSKIAEA